MQGAMGQRAMPGAGGGLGAMGMGQMGMGGPGMDNMLAPGGDMNWPMNMTGNWNMGQPGAG